jgi:hypothetical protein
MVNQSASYEAEETMKKVRTDFLFAQPSFASGFARTLDLWGVLDDYNISVTTLEADEKAIAADWLVVGQDIADAIQNESELNAA